MKIRSTENEHKFTKTLFDNINAYDIQGLTINKKKDKFLAGMEAVELNDDEEFNFKTLSKMFPGNSLFAKLLITDNLKIPFYVITYKNNLFSIYQIKKIRDYKITNSLKYIDSSSISIIEDKLNLNKDAFINWWALVKESIQVKPFVNGAGKRADRTIFDKTLSEYGHLWGGNLDGFIIKDNKIVAIVDNLSAGSNIEKYNPAEQSWFEVWILHINSVLANKLKVPHLIFTIDKYHEDNEIIGLAAVESLNLYSKSKEVEFFNDISPDKNIIKGLDNIKEEIDKLLDIAPVPTFKYKRKVA